MMRSAIIAALLAFGGATAAAQDFRKVIEIVDEMETSLRKSITQELTERKNDVAALRQDIERLRKGQPALVPGDAVERSSGIQTELAALSRRLDVLERRIEKTNDDVVQLTRAVSLLVQELKATVK